MEKKYYKLAIIGGGAAGLLAGISASEKISGKDIIIIEKNQILGRKVFATGNGRCNFSNIYCKWDDYGEKGKALVKAVFDIMGSGQTVKYFESLGIHSRADEEGRLYPYSLEAASFVDLLIGKLKASGVETKLNGEVETLEKTDRGFEIGLGEEKIFSEKLIIATGGKAGLRFGSTGDGYGFARKLGHSLVAPRPALVQIVTEEGKKENIKGVRVKGRVSLYRTGVGAEKYATNADAESRATKGTIDKQPISSEIGEIQFIEEGLSGISIFQLTRHMSDSPENYLVGLDLFPEMEREELAKHLLERKKNLADSEASVLLRTMIPEKLIPIYLNEGKIKNEEKLAVIRDEKIQNLAALLKERLYKVKATKGWIEAQVTVGGINASELDAKTLESLICPGLFLAGELIDVDGPCGGWNLQWAFSSGYLAGHWAARAAASASADHVAPVATDFVVAAAADQAGPSTD